MSELQQLTQQWLEVLAYSLRVGYPFGAGMVSTVNPCGFAMLPAYLSLFLGSQEGSFYERSIWLRTLKALFVGLTISAILAFSLFAGHLVGNSRVAAEPAPDVTLKTANGEFSLSQQRGKVLLLYFSFPG